MSKTLKAFQFLIVCSLMLFIFNLILPIQGYCEPVSITPYKIILNSKLKGQFQDIQAIISMPLSGTYLGEYEVSFEIDDILVAYAYSFRYCYIDDNFLAGFDRQQIQDFLIENGYSGIVPVKVGGWFVVKTSDDSFIVKEFEGYSSIEVIDPDVR